MSEIKLKPCPFCGSEAAIQDKDHGQKAVNCNNIIVCGAESGWAYTEEAAAEKWNRRADTNEH